MYLESHYSVVEFLTQTFAWLHNDTKEAHLSLGKADRTAYVQSSESDFQSQKVISHRRHSSIRAMFTERCYRKLQSTLV